MMRAYREGKTKGYGGVPLHFTSYGEGEPALVCCNGVGVDTHFWKYVVRYFSARHQVVTWDYRGHGKSGKPSVISREKFTVASNVYDLEAVMDELGIRRAVLLGHSMGTQVILEMWRRHPKRVAGLVMMCGAFGRPLDTFWNSRLSAPIFDVVYSVVNMIPGAWARGNAKIMRSWLPMFFAYRMGQVDPQLCRPEDLKPYFEHLAYVDPQVFFLMAGEMQRHTAIKWLEKVDVPTLVVAGEKDTFTPYHLSVQMRDRIPRAELLTVPHGSHVAFVEQPELVNLRLEKFLRERVLTTGEAARDAALESTQAKQLFGEASRKKKKKKISVEAPVSEKQAQARDQAGDQGKDRPRGQAKRKRAAKAAKLRLVK